MHPFYPKSWLNRVISDPDNPTRFLVVFGPAVPAEGDHVWKFKYGYDTIERAERAANNLNNCADRLDWTTLLYNYYPINAPVKWEKPKDPGRGVASHCLVIDSEILSDPTDIREPTTAARLE